MLLLFIALSHSSMMLTSLCLLSFLSGQSRYCRALLCPLLFAISTALVNQLIQHFCCQFIRVSVLSDAFEELPKVMRFLLAM